VATGLIGVEDHLNPLQQHEGIPAREEAAERVRIGREKDPRHLPEGVGEGAGAFLGESFGKGKRFGPGGFLAVRRSPRVISTIPYGGEKQGVKELLRFSEWRCRTAITAALYRDFPTP
jgi:hypothetical protein